MKRLQELRDLLIRHIESAQAEEKELYDRGRMDVKFEEGKEVLRRTLLSSAEKKINAKLASKYEEPVKVSKVLSDVAYELQTPSGTRIPKSHVSELRKFKRPERPINIAPDTIPEPSRAPQTPTQWKRGRPKGSKNRKPDPPSVLLDTRLRPRRH